MRVQWYGKFSVIWPKWSCTVSLPNTNHTSCFCFRLCTSVQCATVPFSTVSYANIHWDNSIFVQNHITHTPVCLFAGDKNFWRRHLLFSSTSHQNTEPGHYFLQGWCEDQKHALDHQVWFSVESAAALNLLYKDIKRVSTESNIVCSVAFSPSLSTALWSTLDLRLYLLVYPFTSKSTSSEIIQLLHWNQKDDLVVLCTAPF